MAQVPYSEGVQSVTPQVSAPDDAQRIQASPAEFGSAIGQGAQALGAGASQAGKFFGEVQVDDSVNTAMTQVNKHLDSYRALVGQDALRAQADTQKNIDEAFKAGRDGLGTPEQQRQYDQTVRMYQQRYVAGIIASHADQASKTYQQQTNRASVDVALSGVANVADDDDHVGIFQQDVRSAMVKQVQADGNGHDPDAVQDALTRADRATYKTQAETVAVRDPVRALGIVEKHKDVLGLEYAQLSAALRTRVNESQALGIADDAFATTAHALQNAVPARTTAAAVTQVVLDQESGNKGPNPGQITPATWERFKTEGLVHPGESYEDPVATRAVAGRAIEKYTEQYQDPARVGVAWFSGPGNVAPQGAVTPYLRDVSDRNGKSTSSYVQDITARLGSQGPLLAARAGVYDKILAQTEGNPILRQAALKEVNQRYQAAEIADMADQKSRKAAQDTSLRKIGDQIVAGAPINIRQADPNLTEEQVEHLEALQRASLNDAVNGRPGDYGPGYGKVQDRIYSTGPDRIIHQEQLTALAAAHEINPTGYAEASKHLELVNKAGAEGRRVQESNFWAAARKQVTLEDPNDHYTTDERLATWNKALPVLNRALEQGRAKTPPVPDEELFDPESKNSVWKALGAPGGPFLPSASQKMAAAINKDAQAAAAIDWQTISKLEDAQAAYDKHQITRDQARILWERNKWGPSSAAAPQVPVGP